MKAVSQHLAQPESSLREIVFVLFDKATYEEYALKFQKW